MYLRNQNYQIMSVIKLFILPGLVFTFIKNFQHWNQNLIFGSLFDCIFDQCQSCTLVWMPNQKFKSWTVSNTRIAKGNTAAIWVHNFHTILYLLYGLVQISAFTGHKNHHASAIVCLQSALLNLSLLESKGWPSCLKRF